LGTNEALGEAGAETVCTDPEELIGTVGTAVRINPWSFFDKVDELTDGYVDTFGYVIRFEGHDYLVPSAEYSFFSPYYAARLSSEVRNCAVEYRPEPGDYIRIVGKIAMCEGKCTGPDLAFVDVVALWELWRPKPDSAAP
jgi:hypothetical protein